MFDKEGFDKHWEQTRDVEGARIDDTRILVDGREWVMEFHFFTSEARDHRVIFKAMQSVNRLTKEPSYQYWMNGAILDVSITEFFSIASTMAVWFTKWNKRPSNG